MCLELLSPFIKEGSKVLDVGSGSGILCAIFGMMVGSTGKVIGIDIYKHLVDKAKDNILHDKPQLIRDGIVNIKLGDGWAGDTNEAPFDVIHVGAGASSLPQALVDQLKPGGRLVIPVGPQYDAQYLKCIDKDQDGNITVEDITGCSYVPLQKINTFIDV
eukprot:TRINITY_DN563_c0_g1_i1.p1 TRINITY_DN563_c0_g1~~TRINITY_DN563_c0_g1_i1.p1  ORF type:complete len:160 (-),score=10.28 TRINITY_DN563_c0_g1_i1:129-608(-)